MKTDLLIATYKTPDLDGFACAYALEEFLERQNINATFSFFGSLQLEVEFVICKFKIKQIPKGTDLITPESKIILVDASDTKGIDKSINPLNVIEVIDHRRNYDKNAFVNATYQVEFVGAAATLITEKFMAENFPISLESANLLYYAIVSNTINFKAKVTTDRDHLACEWLNKTGRVIQDLTNEMFVYKSKNLEVSEEYLISNYIAFPVLKSKTFGIIQLEITDSKDFIDLHYDTLVSIEKNIKLKRELNFVFYTIVDLVDEKNYFISTDISTQDLIRKALNVSSFDLRGVAMLGGILMRKEIVPKINDALK